MANQLIAARGSLIPDGGDVIAIWTTHEGDVAFFDVDDVERDQYLGDLPLHLQWRLTILRRTRYAPERSFGDLLRSAEPIVILEPEQFDFRIRPFALRPVNPSEGKLDQGDLNQRTQDAP